VAIRSRSVSSPFNRPEGNITGITLFLNELAAKRLELLREMVPNVSVIAFMVNPTNSRYDESVFMWAFDLIELDADDLRLEPLGARKVRSPECSPEQRRVCD
jgi:hypothetical protein